jgi:hypothetical protein
MKPGERVTVQSDGAEVSGRVVSGGRDQPLSKHACHYCGRLLTLEEESDRTFGVPGVAVCRACS